MSKDWQRSNLVVGELLVIPKSLFIEPEKAINRLLNVTYVGETDAGILVDCSFKPGVHTNNPDKWHYKMLINWASIWAGHVKVLRTNGEQVHARRAKGQPLALGQVQN